MSKIKAAETLIPEKPVFSVSERDHSAEIFEVDLFCVFPGCTEQERTAFSLLDDKGKLKDKDKPKIKDDFFKAKDRKQMPDPENPGNWLCPIHAMEG